MNNEGGLAHVAVVVPQVGEAIAEAILVKWEVEVGDSIAKGDILFVVDIEKADVEIASFVDGVLIEILVQNGGTVIPGQRVGVVAVESDQVPLDAELIGASAGHSSALVAPTGDGSPVASAPETKGASPLARKRARELEIDIDEVIAFVGRPVSVADVEGYKAASAGNQTQDESGNDLR